MTILHDFSEKIKERGVGVFMLEIFALLALAAASFSLGLSSSRNDTGSEVSQILIDYPDDPTLAAKYKPTGSTTVATKSSSAPQVKSATPMDLEAAYVGSVNGTKYYPIGCSGANRIKPENQILFATMEEAESAGYTQSTTCSY